jgi:hypothetical protein
MVSLMRSALCSPIAKLWWRRRCAMIASSKSSPAMRKLVAPTMPARASTAISVVPPPMSTISEPRGSVTGRPHADARGHGLVDQEHAPRAGALRGVDHGASLDRGDADRHRDHHLGLHPVAALVDLGDEVAQHALGDLEVRDHAVAQRPDGLDVARRLAEHGLRGVADRHAVEQHLVGALLDGDDAGLIQDDAAPAHA